MKNIVVAARKRGDKWRGALIVDNEFQDALVEESLTDVVLGAIAGVLSAEYPEGQEFNISVNIRNSKEQQSEPR